MNEKPKRGHLFVWLFGALLLILIVTFSLLPNPRQRRRPLITMRQEIEQIQFRLKNHAHTPLAPANKSDLAVLPPAEAQELLRSARLKMADLRSYRSVEENEDFRPTMARKLTTTVQRGEDGSLSERLDFTYREKSTGRLFESSVVIAPDGVWRVSDGHFIQESSSTDRTAKRERQIDTLVSLGVPPPDFKAGYEGVTFNQGELSIVRENIDDVNVEYGVAAGHELAAAYLKTQSAIAKESGIYDSLRKAFGPNIVDNVVAAHDYIIDGSGYIVGQVTYSASGKVLNQNLSTEFIPNAEIAQTDFPLNPHHK